MSASGHEGAQRAYEVAHLLNTEVHLESPRGHYVGVLFSAGSGGVRIVWNKGHYGIDQKYIVATTILWRDVVNISPSLVTGEKGRGA